MITVIYVGKIDGQIMTLLQVAKVLVTMATIKDVI